MHALPRHVHRKGEFNNITHIQNAALQNAYHKYLDGKRAQIPFTCFDGYAKNTIKLEIESLSEKGYIQNVRFGIGYVDFMLTDTGISLCENIF